MEKRATTGSLPTPALRIISSPRQKVIQINFLITDSITQMPDSILATAKYNTYPLVIEKSQTKKDTVEYYYFKDVKLGDFKWYRNHNAEKIAITMYKNNDSIAFQFLKTGR